MGEWVSLWKAIMLTFMFIMFELLFGLGCAALIEEINVSYSTGLILVLILDVLAGCGCLVGLILTWIQYAGGKSK